MRPPNEGGGGGGPHLQIGSPAASSPHHTTGGQGQAQADFDAYLSQLSENAKETSSQAALEHAGFDWRERAEAVLDDLIGSGIVFSSEDVTDWART